MTIRSATADDADRLLEIYEFYVANTAISFEIDIPTQEEFRQRIMRTLKKYPYLVLEDNGVIMGYSYAGAFHERAAYSHCCEVTIYIDRNSKGKGYGKALYNALEESLRKMGIINLYACIADPIMKDEYLTNDSERFHHHLGYNKVGEFHKCGYKFGRWYNMIWMEKIIKSNS